MTHVRAGRLRAIVFGSFVAAGFVTIRGVVATEAAHATRDDRSANPLLTLGPEGRALARRVGTWDVTFTSWAKPGAPPVSRRGLIAERRMFGPMLQEVLHTTTNAPDAFTRVDDLTFNRLEGRWEYLSMDTRAPDGLMTAASLDRDPTERIAVSFAPFATPLGGTNTTGQYLRMQESIVARDADHEVKDQYFMPADGNGTKWLAIRYAYTRRS